MKYIQYDPAEFYKITVKKMELDGVYNRLQEAHDRIAELEAENKTLREAMKPISQWSFEAQDGSPAIKELHDDILRVRAAMNGEKG